MHLCSNKWSNTDPNRGGCSLKNKPPCAVTGVTTWQVLPQECYHHIPFTLHVSHYFRHRWENRILPDGGDTTMDLGSTECEANTTQHMQGQNISNKAAPYLKCLQDS